MLVVGLFGFYGAFIYLLAFQKDLATKYLVIALSILSLPPLILTAASALKITSWLNPFLRLSGSHFAISAIMVGLTVQLILAGRKAK